jgi:hypothetical protein
MTGQAAVELLAGVDSTVIRQSKKYIRYQPGKSQLIFQTFVFGKTTQAVTRRAGYFDRDNGIFLEQVGQAVSLVVRSNVGGAIEETRVSQANWNVDKFDGSSSPDNPSGRSLDLDFSQILVIDFEWLGVGSVRAGFVVDGLIRYAHNFNHAGYTAGVYMATPNLPVRYEIAGGAGVTGTHRLQQICSSVISEGGFVEDFGVPSAASNGANVIALTTRQPVLSIRPTQNFKGQINRGRIVPENIDVYTSAQPIYWELVYGGVLTGPATFTGIHNESIVEADALATGIVGGLVIDSGFAIAGGLGANERAGSAASALLSKLPLALNVAGAHPTGTFSDVLSLLATSIPGSSTNVSGALSWREHR